MRHIKRFLRRSMMIFEWALPFASVAFFLIGVWLASWSTGFASVIDGAMSHLVDWYGLFAPIAIFMILAPSLAKILEERQGGGRRFAGHTIIWFAKLRLLACLFAVLFIGLVLGLPLYINHTVSFGGAVLKTVKSLLWMLATSPYFWALYISLIAAFAAMRIKFLAKFLKRSSDTMETVGRGIIPLVPFFMLAIGAYVYNLPHTIGSMVVENGGMVPHLNTVHLLGYPIGANSSKSMLIMYALGAGLTGLACLIWHGGLLVWAKFKVNDFSIRKYFKDYWVRVYPLLWATSSEAVATPLNLYLIQKHYPRVRPEVRRFAVGSGSFLNINGTMMCVFILAGLVAAMMGIEISILQLLFSIPLVFLLGYGVPGIPGELMLFAGPMLALLGLPQGVGDIFLVLYLGLQIGLPDSFRTGANSTDNCLAAVILEKVYEEKFESKFEHIAIDRRLLDIQVVPVVAREKDEETDTLPEMIGLVAQQKKLNEIRPATKTLAGKEVA